MISDPSAGLECRGVRIAFALLAALSFGGAFAAPFAVQVGEARLGLDAPPGFSDVQDTGSPRLLELGESLTSASNRILLFALEDADLRRFTVGDTPFFRRYVIAVTPRGLEHARVSMAAFRNMVADALRDLGAPPAAGVEPRAHLDARPRGAASLLAELRNDHEVVSVLQGSRAPDNPNARGREPPRYLLSTTTLMLLRGKPINAAVYTQFESDSDLEWIRATTSRWIDELQRLNMR
jgi:hypothetical protein